MAVDTANKIRGYRTMLGLTQTDMADKLGITKQSYWLKEHGKISFNDKDKVIILELFKAVDPTLTIDALFFS
ncbi:transcriptional regulator [Aerococcus sp. UMB7834]|uniref:helix-turn-helix transcriptional regulator n=1 Tax=Aerococcus sp. UMB7834 TaxID=3046342 RepID=UPI00254E37FE|nr:transcriptional regulator [Aerococcus sp. UMB7834]MDK6804238.1 transcriptional regulator [Aerococcus sp. UMB7834]